MNEHKQQMKLFVDISVELNGKCNCIVLPLYVIIITIILATHTHTRAPTAVFAPYAVARMPSNAVPITCTMSDIEKSSQNQSRLNKANSNREQ